jgi:hypothetical protein
MRLTSVVTCDTKGTSPPHPWKGKAMQYAARLEDGDYTSDRFCKPYPLFCLISVVYLRNLCGLTHLPGFIATTQLPRTSDADVDILNLRTWLPLPPCRQEISFVPPEHEQCVTKDTEVWSNRNSQVTFGAQVIIFLATVHSYKRK